jgi:hypothetical protein
MHPSRSFIGMDRRFKDSKVTSLERSIFSGRIFFQFFNCLWVAAFQIELKIQT